MQKYLRISKKSSTFAPAFREKLRGAIAQLVEQRTENPCVPGSIPGGTTEKKRDPFCNEPQKLNKKLLGFYYETFL